MRGPFYAISALFLLLLSGCASPAEKPYVAFTPQFARTAAAHSLLLKAAQPVAVKHNVSVYGMHAVCDTSGEFWVSELKIAQQQFFDAYAEKDGKRALLFVNCAGKPLTLVAASSDINLALIISGIKYGYDQRLLQIQTANKPELYVKNYLAIFDQRFEETWLLTSPSLSEITSWVEKEASLDADLGIFTRSQKLISKLLSAMGASTYWSGMVGVIALSIIGYLLTFIPNFVARNRPTGWKLAIGLTTAILVGLFWTVPAISVLLLFGSGMIDHQLQLQAITGVDLNQQFQLYWDISKNIGHFSWVFAIFLGLIIAILLFLPFLARVGLLIGMKDEEKWVFDFYRYAYLVERMFCAALNLPGFVDRKSQDGDISANVAGYAEEYAKSAGHEHFGQAISKFFRTWTLWAVILAALPGAAMMLLLANAAGQFGKEILSITWVNDLVDIAGQRTKYIGPEGKLVNNLPQLGHRYDSLANLFAVVLLAYLPLTLIVWLAL